MATVRTHILQNLLHGTVREKYELDVLFLWSATVKYTIIAGMGYCASCASTMSMLAEESLHSVEGFVEVPCKSLGSIEETWKKFSK